MLPYLVINFLVFVAPIGGISAIQLKTQPILPYSKILFDSLELCYSYWKDFPKPMSNFC